MKIDEVRCDFCNELIVRKHREEDKLWLGGTTSSKYNISMESPKTSKNFDLCSKCYYEINKLVLKKKKVTK